MKKRGRLRKGLAMLLTATMVLGLMPGAGTMKVLAVESDENTVNTVSSNEAMTQEPTPEQTDVQAPEQTDVQTPEQAEDKLITTWQWIDEEEYIDEETGSLALPGASEQTPAYFEDVTAFLPIQIKATVVSEYDSENPETGAAEETITLGDWACEEYPEEGAYTGSYTFTATLPEGYELSEEAEALTVTVELGGAQTYETTGADGYDNGFCTTYNASEGSCSNTSHENCSGYQPATDSDGDGVYEIGNAGQLYWFAGLVNGKLDGVKCNTSANAVLTSDITVNIGLKDKNGLLDSLVYDESGQVTNGNSFTSWTPIGNIAYNYTGTFDGQEHTISGLYFNDTKTTYVGLFGWSDGTIKNVGVVDSYFSGQDRVGGVCGKSRGSIENSYNTGTVSGTSSSVGGVCGYSERGSIENSHNTGAVSGTESVGGVCGYSSSSSSIANSYNTGAVSGTESVGGVCGNSSSSNITNSHNTGAVSGTGIYVGGVCGYSSSSSSITNSYNTGAVSGTRYVGGLCGYSSSSITNSHNTGAVSGTGIYVGGVCGYSGSSIANSYNTGAVSGTESVGGVCGYSGSSSIANSYNTGAVSGTSEVGGVCGNSIGSITNSYNTGNVRGSNCGGVCGDNNKGKITSCYNIGSSKYGVCINGTVTNCYYSNLADGTKGQYVTFDTLCNGTLPQGFDASVWDAGLVVSTTDEYKTYRLPSLKGVGDSQTISIGYYDFGSGNEMFNAISTAEQLVALAKDSSKWDNNYVLTADIDMAGKRMTPIGNNAKSFTGKFSGKGHVIKNLIIDQSITQYVGLFGKNTGVIQDVGIEGDSISGYANVGGLCGENAGSISGCYVTATVIGKFDPIGGLCGKATSGSSVTNCYYAGEVIGSPNPGAICGKIEEGSSISNSFSAGVTGYSYCYTDSGASIISIPDLCNSSSLPSGLDNSVWGTGEFVDQTGIVGTYKLPYLKKVGNQQTISRGLYDFGTGEGLLTCFPISTPEDLIALANDSSKWGANYRYVLVNDIDMTGKDISPIGVDAQKGFKGRFSGNGHVVKNLTIEREGEDYIGLFGYNAGLIMDVGIEGGSIKGHSYIGAVCGDNHGTISGCYNTATVIGEYQKIGGICGRIWGGTVKNCYNAGEVNGGGIYGERPGKDDIVSNCFSASATGDSYCYDENTTKISISDLCSSELLPSDLDSSFWKKGALVSQTEDIYTYRLPSFSWEKTPHTLSCGLYDYGTGEGSLACSGISTAEELVALANDSSKWGKNYILTADIDMSGKEISPIGNSTKNFTGKFSGNGHVVKNLTIDRTGMDYTGLFGWNKGLIMDLGIEGGGIKGDSYVGALCGQNLGTISGCYNTASVYGERYYHGGLCGFMQDGGNMKNCYNTGTVSGNDNVGGICGYVQSGSTLESCYNTATVSGTTNFVGGVFGLSGGTVKNCYYNTDYCQKEGSSGSNETNAQRGITTAELCNGSLPEGFDESVWNAGSNEGQKIEGRFDNTEYKLPAIKKAGTQQSIKVSLYDFGINGASDWCPYTAVSTADELVALGDNSSRWNENYVLTADIDMSGKTFSPIGKIYSENQSTVNKSFKGKFSGDGHVVKNLTIDVTERQVGFFGYNAGLIMNLGIWNGDITGTSSVGGLCGENTGTILNCYYTGKVNGSDTSVGGLCGFNDNTITNCYTKSSVNGSDKVGGVCGTNYGLHGGTIKNCYGYGTVTGSGTNLGGVCGQNDTSYTTTITNCYYNKDICQTGGITGSDISGSAEGRKTREFNSASAFNNWDFSSSWELEPIFERPVLKAVKETYFAGSGTKEEPYRVSDLDTLKVMRNYVNAGHGENVYFTQTADIDMSPVYNNTDSFSWTPIGTKDKPFKGIYSGGNYAIKGMYIDTTTDYQGLFGYSEGTIRNLGLVDGSIKGDEYVGAVCGDNNGTIQNCYNTCTVSGTNYVGGVCGTNQKTLVNCYDIGTGTCTNASVGGVCGANTGKVSNCYTEKEQTNGTWDKTLKQFNKGEVAYLLSQGATLDDSTYDGSVWGQKLSGEDKQDYPVLGGLTVYQNETYKGCADAPGDVTYIYANTAAEPVYAAHAMTKVDKKDPTCTEDGNNEYWTCSYETDVYYKDEGRTEKYNSYEDEINIPATGHKDEDKDGKCDTCATYLDGIGAKLAGYSLSLNGNIGVNFYMELSEEIAGNESACMEFTLPNTAEKTKVYVTGNHEDGATATTSTVGDKTYYVFSCEVAAKEMTDEIQAQMIAGENKGTVYTYTVTDYADYILSHTETYGENVVTLVKAMLNYGAYSQTYFGYQTEKLANAELAEADKTLGDLTAEELITYKASVNKNEAVCTFASAYLTLQSETAVHVYVKLADGVSEEDVAFKIDDSEIAKENLVKGTGTYKGYYMLSVDNIQASALDDKHTFSVTAGDQTASLSYGPMSYCYSILAGDSTSAELKNVVKALYAFNQAAESYGAN